MDERKDTIRDPALLSKSLQIGRDADRVSLERLNGDKRREMLPSVCRVAGSRNASFEENAFVQRLDG